MESDSRSLGDSAYPSAGVSRLSVGSAPGSVPNCTCHNTGICTRCILASLDHDFLDTRDPVIDWQTAQEYGLFSMAADLVRDHVARLRAGAATDVIVLDEWRVRRFVNREGS